jgi:hypothetical protein
MSGFPIDLKLDHRSDGSLSPADTKYYMQQDRNIYPNKQTPNLCTQPSRQSRTANYYNQPALYGSGILAPSLTTTSPIGNLSSPPTRSSYPQLEISRCTALSTRKHVSTSSSEAIVPSTVTSPAIFVSTLPLVGMQNIRSSSSSDSIASRSAEISGEYLVV